MRFRDLTVAFLLLAACGKNDAAPANPLLPSAIPDAFPGAGARAKEEYEDAERRAKRLIECLGGVTSDESWFGDCVPPHPAIEVVDHVPPIAVHRGVHSAGTMLPYSLLLTFSGAWFRPELVLFDRERAAVTGTFFTADTGFALPAAATLSLAPDGRIAEARIWFDQYRASHQVWRVAPEREKRAPQVVVARHNSGELVQLNLLERFAAASRRHDEPALAALYTDDAMFVDESAGTNTVGSNYPARQFGPGRDVVVQRGWAAGDFIVAEVLRTESPSSLLSTLEILEVAQGRIVRHRSFKNGLHADVDAALVPLARRGAAPILHADRVTLFEGYWRFDSEELTSKGVRRHGYAFRREPVPLDSGAVQRLTATVASESSVVEFWGEKRCGGFHPDYSLLWEAAGKRYEALLCFGCGEMKWIAPDGKMTRYDLTHWARLSLQSALYEYHETASSSAGHAH